MSGTVIILGITFALLASMFVWVPLLQSAETLARRYPQHPGEMPDLREDDTSPQFTGRVA